MKLEIYWQGNADFSPERGYSSVILSFPDNGKEYNVSLPSVPVATLSRLPVLCKGSQQFLMRQQTTTNISIREEDLSTLRLTLIAYELRETGNCTMLMSSGEVKREKVGVCTERKLEYSGLSSIDPDHDYSLLLSCSPENHTVTAVLTKGSQQERLNKHEQILAKIERIIGNDEAFTLFLNPFREGQYNRALRRLCTFDHSGIMKGNLVGTLFDPNRAPINPKVRLIFIVLKIHQYDLSIDLYEKNANGQSAMDLLMEKNPCLDQLILADLDWALGGEISTVEESVYPKPI